MAYSHPVRFEWDDAKDLANQNKHGVSFHEATELFANDVDCLELFDDVHSELEERFITIGPILVVWTERAEDVIRLISARWATTHEAELYRKHMDQFR